MWVSHGMHWSCCWDGAEQAAVELGGGVKRHWGHPSPVIRSPALIRVQAGAPGSCRYDPQGGLACPPAPALSLQTETHPRAACPKSSKEPDPGSGGCPDPPAPAARQDLPCCPSEWGHGAGGSDAGWGSGTTGTVRVCWGFIGQSLYLHRAWGKSALGAAQGQWGN